LKLSRALSPDMLASLPSTADRGRHGLELVLRYAARPPKEQERERGANRGEDGAGEESRLEALGQRDDAVGAGVRRQVVLGAGDGHGRDDGDSERRAHLEGGVAKAGGKPRLALGDAGEGGDRGGDEGEADAGSKTSSPKKMSPK
jgi:hypothetical protein